MGTFGILGENLRLGAVPLDPCLKTTANTSHLYDSSNTLDTEQFQASTKQVVVSTVITSPDGVFELSGLRVAQPTK